MTRYLVIVVLILGVVGLVLGAVFIAQGQSIKGMITERMAEERVVYDGEEFKTNSVIDTPKEAELMSQVLREHRMELGFYTDLARDDPKRDTILKAITIENALNLAVLGDGVSTVVTGSGIFMVITGIALLGTGITLHRLNGRHTKTTS